MGWYESMDLRRLTDEIINFKKHPEDLIKMSKIAANICDGEGINRVVYVINEVCN